MKTFSSSILSVKESTSRQTTTLKNIKENQSELIKLLEFNEAIANADITNTRDYYIGLLKLANNSNSSYDSVYSAVFNQYDAVSTTVKAMLGHNASCCSTMNEYRENLMSLVNKFSKYPPDRSIKLNSICKHPIGMDGVTILQPIRDYSTDVIKAIETNTLDEFVQNAPDMEHRICNFISKTIGIEHSLGVRELLDNYDKYFEFREIEAHPVNINSLIYSAEEVNGNIYIAPMDFEGFGLCDTVISILKTNSNKFKNPNTVRSVVINICNALTVYATLIGKFRDIIEAKREYVCKCNYIALSKALFEDKTIKESIEMFGDEIDSESMFATLDYSDFNRTDFMDLSLVAENMYSLYKSDAIKQSMALEAKLLAEGKYEELYMVQEALGQKIKNGIGKLIEAVKAMIEKFIEKLIGNFASEKAYLTKYKNIILNTGIDPATKLTFDGDVLGGMQRLKTEQFKIPTIAYSELIKDPKIFEDGSGMAFFQKYFSGIKIDRSKVNEENDLATAVKVHYGFKDGKTYEATFGDLNIPEIYQWLLDTEKESKNLRIESKNIQRTYDNYIRSAAKQGNAQATNNQPVNASTVYYSAIYDKFIEVDIQAPQKDNSGGNNTAPNSGNDNQPEQKTNTRLTRGDTDAEVQKTNDTEQQITRNMEIYVKICQKVIAARITAFEYIHKNMMDIMRYIVKSKLGNKAGEISDSKNPTNGNNQDNDQPAANNPTPNNPTQNAGRKKK